MSLYGAISPLLGMGGSLGVTLEVDSRGKRAPLAWVSCVTNWARTRAWVLWWQRQEESVGWVPVEKGIPLGECLAGQTLEHCQARDGRG